MPRGVRKLQDDALIALRGAVRKAIAERTRAGLPVYVWKNGRVVDLNAPKSRVSVKRVKSSRKSKA